MMTILALLRFVLLLLHLFVGLYITLWHHTINRRSFNHPKYQCAIQWWLGAIAYILGIRIEVLGDLTESATLLVANHISWLDIPVIGYAANPRFLSKSEVKKWPIIGWLAQSAGTLFLQRGEASATESAKQAIISGLESGGKVIIFPEGTTSDGSSMKHFHARLYAAPIQTQSLVQPVALIYLNNKGECNTIVPYVGKQTLLSNVWNIARQRESYVQVHFLTPLNVDGKSRDVLAQSSAQAIKLVYNSVLKR